MKSREENKDSFSALKQGQIQPNPKLWLLHANESFVKMPRKNVLNFLEGEQVRLCQEIESKRREISALAQKLVVLEPEPQSVDPKLREYVRAGQLQSIDEESD